MTPLKICLVASEVAPLAKTGGLGDVTAALATHLARAGHDVRVFLPLYRRLHEQGRTFAAVPGLERLPVSLGPRSGVVTVRSTPLDGSGIDVLCVDCPEVYDRPGIYTGDEDEHVRFALLTRAALAACQQTHWAPDIVHVHDWHAALAPLYLRLLSSWDDLFAHTKSVLTIHNIGYQGVVGAEASADLGLDDAEHLLHRQDLAQGRINFLKTGILYADVVTTVSRTYAAEIQTEALGMGLHDLLQSRSSNLVGIVNGVDYETWSPENDPLIPQPYSARSLDGKAHNKRVLLESLGLAATETAPLFGIVSRLAYQKGFELLFETLPELLARADVRVAVLGSGEGRYERFFTDLMRSHPGRVCFWRGYNNDLAHLIEAGADFFLMPSRYEPCGLNQMYSLRYGTVPIVRRTGGLADTVELFDPATGEGTGIVFDHFNDEAMRWALSTALDLYAQPKLFRRLIENGMAADFSWERQIKHYEDLYRRLRSHHIAAHARKGSERPEVPSSGAPSTRHMASARRGGDGGAVAVAEPQVVPSTSSGRAAVAAAAKVAKTGPVTKSRKKAATGAGARKTTKSATVPATKKATKTAAKKATKKTTKAATKKTTKTTTAKKTTKTAAKKAPKKAAKKATKSTKASAKKASTSAAKTTTKKASSKKSGTRSAGKAKASSRGKKKSASAKRKAR